MIKTVKGTGANLSRSSKLIGRDSAPVGQLESSKIAHNAKVVQEERKMKVWNFGEFVDVEFGQKVLVARCGSGRSYFGEFGKIARATDKHIVVVTDSGAVVKTDMDLNTVGKAAKAGYFVSLRVDGREDMIHECVMYWNKKKLCLENK